MTDKKNGTEQGDINLELKDSNISGDKKIIGASSANKSRRTALLGAIGVAGAASLPSEWKKPVIDGLVLPAHAQMSPSVITQSATTIIQQSQSGTVEGTASCAKYVSQYGAVVGTTGGEFTQGVGFEATIKYTVSEATLCQDNMGGTGTVISTNGNNFYRDVNYTSAANVSAYYNSFLSYSSTGFGVTETTFSVYTTYTVSATATTEVSISA